MQQQVRVRQQDGIARVELVARENFPRLSRALLVELEATVRNLQADVNCAGIVIHGNERAFAAGAEMAEVSVLTSSTALAFAQRAQAFFEAIEGLRKPVLAAISGYCLGGGLDLALACWRRVATPQAIFGHPGTTLGLVTGWGGTQRLARLLGRPRAMELLLSGKRISAAEAHQIGLVDKVVPASELWAAARAEAQALRARSTSFWEARAST